jgi:hypothetical protein
MIYYESFREAGGGVLFSIPMASGIIAMDVEI